MRFSSVFGAIALASTALSAPATFTPHDSINLAVSVPASTSSSGSGNMYMQFSFPSTYTWAAFGIGSRMAGSTIFLIYADGNGNVTLSPRNGVGQVMPQFSSSINSQTTLLAGSGVANGLMVANIKFSAASSTINVAGTSTNWISSWSEGSPLNSASQSAVIQQHDAHAQFSLDLSKATQAEDVNPFIQAASSPGASSSGSGTAAPTGVSTPVATNPAASGNSGVSTGPSVSYILMLQRAHGIIMAITVVILLPLGAVLIRLVGGVWLHAGVQLLGLILIIAGFGLGVHLGDETGLLYQSEGKTHTTFGTVIFAFFLIQPLGGLIHHMQYRKTSARGPAGHAHIWFGRIILILAIINGGLGLKLALASSSLKIAYGVVAGVVGLIYIASVSFALLKQKKSAGGNGVRGEKSVAEVGSQNSQTVEGVHASK